MQVKATKTMAAYLRKMIPEYDFILNQYSREKYALMVDYDIGRNMVDYSPKTGKFNVISVIYPDEYYAMPEQLTTAALSRAFRKSDGTETGFIAELRDAIAI